MDNVKAVKKENYERIENLVEVVTEYKATNIIVGGKVFISAEDAKVILAMTNRTEDPDESHKILWQSRELLRSFAKQILYQPSDLDAEIIDIIEKYK